MAGLCPAEDCSVIIVLLVPTAQSQRAQNQIRVMPTRVVSINFSQPKSQANYYGYEIAPDQPAQAYADSNIPCPGSFFKLFFDNDVYETLVRNTNAYTEFKNAEAGGGRSWKPIHTAHLKIWFGIVIYMGIHGPKSGKLSNFWHRDDHGPVHRHASLHILFLL